MLLFPSPSKQPKPTSPGALLQTLFETRQPATFSSVILSKYLCPALDALPLDQRSNLVRILLEAEQGSLYDVPLHFDRLGLDSDGGSEPEDDDYNLETIDLEARKGRIVGLKGQDQRVAEEIVSWLAILWRTGIERGLESKSVHSALMFCSNLSSDAVVTLEIANSKDKVVYFGAEPVIRHIAWVWRELLIKRISIGDTETVTTILKSLGKKPIGEILSWLPTEEDEALSQKGYYLNHWSNDIQRIVVGKLRGLLERLHCDH